MLTQPNPQWFVSQATSLAGSAFCTVLGATDFGEVGLELARHSA